MASKRADAKKIVESSTGEVVEQVALNFLVYSNIQLFIEKGSKITWQQIKYDLTKEFQEELEGWKVYLNIMQLGFYKVSYRYLTFQCVDVISLVVSNSDVETITLRNTTGHKFATFLAANFKQMYHFLGPVKNMESLLYATQKYINTSDIINILVKESTKFRKTPTQMYKTN